MTARVLVVDDLLPNVKLLAAKLSSEYYDVITAYSGPEALDRVREEKPDIVLLDVMMPGMDGFEVCGRLKSDPETAHIPVIMVTALSDQRDRVQGLEAGADDFLTKPVEDIALFARVRSLVRLKLMTDELRLREETGNKFGIGNSMVDPDMEIGSDAQIMIIEDSPVSGQFLQNTLSVKYNVTVQSDCKEAIVSARSGAFDLIIATLNHADFDSLRFCSQLRTMEETRQVPILTIVDEGDSSRLVKALDLGVNDYLIRPIDQNELQARTLTQLRRKRYQDRLRHNYHLSLAMAVTDGLTGLYNRRYVMTHLENLLAQPRLEDRPVSLVMMDIDRFKTINDTYGHGVGDEVLKEYAQRVQRVVRGVDLVARLGGEEFTVVMPDTDVGVAGIVAERLRQSISDDPFPVSTPSGQLNVTCSFGVAATEGDEDADELFRRADGALYRAKNQGRNRVEIVSNDDAPIDIEHARLRAVAR